MDGLFIIVASRATDPGQARNRSPVGKERDAHVSGSGRCLDHIHAVISQGGLARYGSARSVGHLKARDDEIRRETLDGRRGGAGLCGLVVEDENVLPWMLGEKGGGWVVSIVVLDDGMAERGGGRGGAGERLAVRDEDVVRRI